VTRRPDGMQRRHAEAMARYRDLGWIARRRVDARVVGRLLRSARFRRAGLVLVSVQLLVLGCAWHWDLTGWRRDLMRAAPALLAVPWGAAVRRRAIASILQADRQNRD